VEVIDGRSPERKQHEVEQDAEFRRRWEAEGATVRARLKTYSEDELAKALNLGVDTLRQWRYRRSGGPKFVKIGRTTFYRQADLDEWFDRHSLDVEVGA
jgi:hypothetical protein